MSTCWHVPPVDEHSLPYLFPVFFVGLWLTVTTVLGIASGWFSLQHRYPVAHEPVLLRLRGRSGSMGVGVAMSGILSLGACRSGLRIGIWRLFGPFQRPFLVPWQDIRAEPSRALFTPMVRLTFGDGGRLTIDARSWTRLREAAAAAGARDLPSPTPVVTREAAARGAVLQWALGTLVVGCFFYVVPRLEGGQPAPSIAVCFGFPAVVFGIGTAIRLLRQG